MALLVRDGNEVNLPGDGPESGGAMKMRKMGVKKVEEKMSLELKYCERCGGLWLRPAGGSQVYCIVCARDMAEMPPASRELEGGCLEGRCFEDSGEEGVNGIEEFESLEAMRNTGGGL
jgi:tRNA(Ile2) C34 agmatinyltransferase TiaS